MDPKYGSQTYIIKNNYNVNQYYNNDINKIQNYNINNNVTTITNNYAKKNLINIDNNIDQQGQLFNNNSNVEDKKINGKDIANDLNPKRNYNSKIGNQRESKEENNNTNNKDSVTPGGDDEQEIRNYYKYIQNEYANNNSTNTLSPNTKIEKEQNELNNNSFSFSAFTKPSLVAIENVGNTSYMSATIRILANIEKIVKHYLKELNKITDNFQEIPLSYAFSRIIFHLYPFPQDSLKKSISLYNFYRTVLLLNKSFQGEKTKNAIDFLNFLIETLHDDDKTLQNQNNNRDNINDKNVEFEEYANFLKQNEKSIIFDNFAWINKKVRKCTTCKEEKIKYHYYFTYELDIFDSLNNIIITGGNKKDINIFECIKHQCDKKNLYNNYCYNCKRKTNFEEESTICATPKYFIFLLSLNEDKNRQALQDSNLDFLIDNELKLNDIIKGQTINYLYEPVGKVDYYFDKKEYISSCRNPIDNNWYKYEDIQNKIGKVQFNKDNFKYNCKNNYFPVIVVYKIKKLDNNINN